MEQFFWALERLAQVCQHSAYRASTAQHSTAQHSTAQHSTAQHSTAQPSLVYLLFCRLLSKAGLICVCPMPQALHGDISQGQREKILQKFREDKFSVLVATDVAARGLDIPNVELVVHYDLPDQVEGFLHRYRS